jgi:hypothetical protein
VSKAPVSKQRAKHSRAVGFLGKWEEVKERDNLKNDPFF